MNTLITIVSKSPNTILYQCIYNLYKFQIKDESAEKICVVDSDSDDISIYNKISEDFPNVDICLIKNINYEYGAWKYAYTQYPNYDIYMCIQDSVIPINTVPLSIINNETVFVFYEDSGYNSHMSIKELGIDSLKKSKLNEFKYSEIIHTDFRMAGHNSFIVNNYIMKDILNTFTDPPVNKDGSCIYERNFGLYFILHNINTHNLYYYFGKYHGKRN
jgi:hypothetical protein